MSESRAEKPEASVFAWIVNGSSLTSGTATARIERREGGSDDVEYLQSDGTTWADAPHNFTLETGATIGDNDLDQDRWYLFWTVPDTAAGHNISVVATHSARKEKLVDGPYYIEEGSYDVQLS